MADYVLPSAVEKRVRYFDGQYLQDQDFIDEQDYQLDREQRHNRLLHGPGIAEGLAVTATAPNQVTVAPGTALDSDGHQLVLGEATTVDLPAGTFSNQQGVQLYISYLASAADPQTTAGSADFTRWLERPELTALTAGASYEGTASPVLLARLALDGAGRVAVDATVRSYAGLRLPGPAADAPTLTSASSGLAHLAGSLTVDGSVGIGTTAPAATLHLNVPSSGTPVNALQIDVQSFQTQPNAVASDFLRVRDIGAGGTHFLIRGDAHVGIATSAPVADLEIGNFDNVDRFVALKAAGGNVHRVGLKLFTWKEDFGYSIQFDERAAGPNGLHIKTHNADPAGVTRLYVTLDGNLGIGNTAPAARLDVTGAGGSNVDLQVNGRLRSNNNDGGLWISTDRFVGGLNTSQVGIFNNGAWRLNVTNAGNVGIATTAPVADLEVGSFDGVDRFIALKASGGDVHRVGLRLFTWQENFGYSIMFDERAVGPNGLHIKTHNVNATGETRLFIGQDGKVGIGNTAPAARLDVTGSGGSNVDLQVNGRLRSNNNDGGLWISTDRFVGGVNTSQVGFYNNGAWRLNVTSAGKVGIAAAAPVADLEIGAFDGPDRFLALKASGGNLCRVGLKLFTWKEDFGYSIQFDERAVGPDGLHIKTHNVNATGETRLFIGQDGSVGIGTVNPRGQKLYVDGAVYASGAMWANGGLYYWWLNEGWKMINNRANNIAGSDPTGNRPFSDLRLKTDVRPIDGALAKVRRLQGRRYRWGDAGLEHLTRDEVDGTSAGPGATAEQNRQVQEVARHRAVAELAGDRLGLIAQEVEEVVPELVAEDRDGYKRLSYQQLTALLVEAVKEQDEALRTLASQLAARPVPDDSAS